MAEPARAVELTKAAAWPAIGLLPPDEERGTTGMTLAIITEAVLFATLFFAYFYLGHGQVAWPAHIPEIRLPLVLSAILLVSSGTLQWSEHALKIGAAATARVLLAATVVLGLLFLAIQALEYRDHLREVRPTTNAYGSLFYAITSFHALHVVAGLVMLGFVLALPDLQPRQAPHRPLRNAALYWHFVDAVWIVVVVLLYLLPRWRA